MTLVLQFVCIWVVFMHQCRYETATYMLSFHCCHSTIKHHDQHDQHSINIIAHYDRHDHHDQHQHDQFDLTLLRIMRSSRRCKSWSWAVSSGSPDESNSNTTARLEYKIISSWHWFYSLLSGLGDKDEGSTQKS